MTNEELADDLFMLVQHDQGKGFICDGMGFLSREEIIGVARASLMYTERVAQKLREWIKRESDEGRKS